MRNRKPPRCIFSSCLKLLRWRVTRKRRFVLLLTRDTRASGSTHIASTTQQRAQIYGRARRRSERTEQRGASTRPACSPPQRTYSSSPPQRTKFDNGPIRMVRAGVCKSLRALRAAHEARLRACPSVCHTLFDRLLIEAQAAGPRCRERVSQCSQRCTCSARLTRRDKPDDTNLN